jgi:hypothetical protein
MNRDRAERRAIQDAQPLEDNVVMQNSERSHFGMMKSFCPAVRKSSTTPCT